MLSCSLLTLPPFLSFPFFRALLLLQVFAVVELAGKQYKVCPNDLVFVDKREGLEPNDVIECHRVLLLGSRTETIIGRPYIQPNASVVCAVESQFMEMKKIIFKKKRRTNYRRNNSFRHRLTRLRVLSINGIEP